MKVENTEVELLSNVAKILTEKMDPLDLVNSLARTFNKYGRVSGKFIELNKLNIYIYEDSTKKLRDYSKGLAAIDDVCPKEFSDKLYFVLEQFRSFTFFLNDRGYKLDDDLKIHTIKGFNDDNTLLFRLKKGDVPFGVLELCFSGTIANLLNFDFFVLLSVLTYQISLQLNNNVLAQQMGTNIDFHESMKNIAKIIETQYELNYVIPLIGEMIDKFIPRHLIYIFLGNGESVPFKLVWPAKCNETRVMKLLSDVKSDSKAILLDNDKSGIFPLMGKKTILGCIIAHSPDSKLSKQEIEYLEQLSTQSTITLQRASVYAKTLKDATMDALTGLNNRRQFELRLKQEVASATRRDLPLCAMMLDVDFFKKVNDTYGHAVGDCVLKNISAMIKKSIRESDIPSRYGGEEFCVLLPMTNIEEAKTVAERLRAVIDATRIDYKNEETGEVEVSLNKTVSIGLYQFKSSDTAQELYQKADKALYDAKTTGRNKVVVNEE